MSSELINKNLLRENLLNRLSVRSEEYLLAQEKFICKVIDEQPIVDAEPVIHAHWEKVYGYVTPGGDPVWVCSNCGKGMHVWGAEASTYNRDISDSHQWVACPNCGAKMDGKK